MNFTVVNRWGQLPSKNKHVIPLQFSWCTFLTKKYIKMNKPSDLWTFESLHNINLSCSIPPLFVRSIIYRKIDFLNFEINAKKNEYVSTQTVFYLYNKKVNFSNTTKWKWASTWNGVYPPNNETETQRLKIETGFQSITLIDLAKDNIAIDYSLHDNLFKIFYHLR